ncbi:hypothetical protein BDN70DRAFT_875675 [Pholiota conissans]|uniref:Uncharacterized protein n=1 Tax=Pholiota conissans TaxID=109636 RepID=A0A9P5Z783_9AGAR|nr:hypothetical protein BDN70DRAFT_875675 [Pholiota conissans]
MYICDVETTEQSATTKKHSSRHVESKRTITAYECLKNGINPRRLSNKTRINNNVSYQ